MSDWDDETYVTDWDEGSVTDETNFAAVLSEHQVPTLLVIAGGSIGEIFPLRSGSSVIGRAREAQLPLRDEGVSRTHARVHVDDDAVFLEDLGSTNGTFVNGIRVTERVRLQQGDKVQLGHLSILRFAHHDDVDDSFQRHMYESALRDGLTKIFNKRYLRERLISELRFAERHHTSLALLLFDLDHFKQVNDTYGHLAGDQVLVTVAQALAHALRGEDVVARFGGEEFAVILRGIPAENARQGAERLRRLVEALTIELEGGGPMRVTTSVGLATFPELPARTPDELLEAADRSLYRAKQGGRNRVGD